MAESYPREAPNRPAPTGDPSGSDSSFWKPIVIGTVLGLLIIALLSLPSLTGRPSPDLDVSPVDLAELEIHEDWDEAPELDRMVKPSFPEQERKDGIEGHVELQIVVDHLGRVVDAKLLSSTPTPAFGESALEAILKWRFKPAKKDGKPIAVRLGQTMDFNLRDRPPTGL